MRGRLTPELWARVVATTRVIERLFQRERDELLSYAWEAADRAANDPRARADVSIDGWVMLQVRARLKDALRKLGPVSRRMRMLGYSVMFLRDYELSHSRDGARSADDLIEWLHDARTPLEQALASDQHRLLARALRHVPRRERYVLEQSLAGRKLGEVAIELGVSDARASQLRTRAIERLRLLLEPAEDLRGRHGADAAEALQARDRDLGHAQE